MNAKQIVLSLVLVDFLATTVWALAELGLAGAFAVVTHNPATILLTFDLLIALTIATVWMVSDAKQRGVNPWPYVALTLGTGSAGPLAYLIGRFADAEAPRAVAAA